MRIIDLLNRIANKENDKLPKKIEFRDEIYYLEEDEYMYYKTKNNNELMEELLSTWDLVSEVEIIEDKPKVTVEMTEEEYFRYLNIKNIGNQPVEYKEYEDIEELSYAEWNENKYDLDKELYYIKKINALIRNQKKIIEELKKLKEEK